MCSRRSGDWKQIRARVSFSGQDLHAVINMKKLLKHCSLMLKACIQTSIPCVNNEAGVIEGGSLVETIAMRSDLASITNLRLDNHDGDGTVGDVVAVLQDADLMLTHLLRNEGDACVEKEERWRDKGRMANNYCMCVFLVFNVTNVVVGHPLQQTGFTAPRWCLDAGSQQAQVRLINVQREICCRAEFDLRALLGVL